MSYAEFLAGKRIAQEWSGREFEDPDVHPMLHPFQRDIVRWACRKGRSAIFLDTGLGKTFVQLEWARLLGERTIIIAPLSVTRQTIREGVKIGVGVRYIRSMADVGESGIYICNYEMTEALDFSAFGAVVLDESSILKSIAGVTRRYLTEKCQSIRYRLCCTATPAPNDQSEIGNHAEFLGVCKTSEMLAMFFVHANKQDEREEHDGSITRKKHSNKQGQEWRLKNHARGPFYEWMASWAIAMTRPSELGYSDEGYILPPLTVTPVIVRSDYVPEGELFHSKLSGVMDRAKVRRSTIPDRLSQVGEILSRHEGQWIIWAGLQSETDALRETVQGCREVKGDDSQEQKIADLEDFQDGRYRILISKPKICGHGMNFQNASNMIFFGLSDSWESYYQCIRREWRYGQRSPVNVYIVMSDAEQEILANVKRKERVARLMTSELLRNIAVHERKELHLSNDTPAIGLAFQPAEHGENYTAIHGDSCEELPKLAENSVDLSVYSPPFADLYTYTNSERDLGNSRDWGEFFKHYQFIIREVLRVTRPGRLSCVHVSDIPAMEVKDGYIGMRDFPGAVIMAHEEAGWTFVGRAFVQKNPQAQAIRTKSKALLFAQLRKDSSHSRPAIVDQILIFKKDGECEVPVKPVENGDMDNETWINWAHGIWFGIQESDVLKYHDARAADDEKHICPLQLGTIERCIKLYSNPGETVLTPFMGIGSEVYQAVRFGRRGVGIELKESYFRIAADNCRYAESHFIGQDLFGEAARA